MKKLTLKKSLLCSSVLLALGLNTEAVLAVDYGPDNNFTMLDSAGGAIGGTNAVDIIWDGTLNTDVATAVSNMTISSIVPFFGTPWFAHDVTVYGPGSYILDACPAPAAPDGKAADGSSNCAVGATAYTLNVGAGQVGVHMLFDWNSSVNIDVINVWDVNSAWQFGPNDGTGSSKLQAADSPCVAAGKKSAGTPEECAKFYATEWLFTTTDPDGNGIPGTGMIDGPFSGANATFNVRALGKFITSNDSVFATENSSVVIGNVTDNDDLGGAVGTATVSAFDATSDQGGSVVDNGDGTYTYMPAVNFRGIDSFSYTVSDDVTSITGKVEIVVLSEAAADAFFSQSKSAGVTSVNSDDGVGSTGLLALSLMLLLSPLRLFSRRK